MRIELGERRHEENFDFPPLSDLEDDEDSDIETRDPDPYNEGFDQLFAISGKQRAKFERKKART